MLFRGKPVNNGEVSQLRTPLLMWPIAREACLLIWKCREHFGRLLVVPTTFGILLSLANLYWFTEKDDTWRTMLFSFLIVIPHFLIFTFLAVSCHRSILMGTHSVSRFGVPGWSMRETRFFLWLVGIYLLGYLFMVLFGAGLGMITFAAAEWLGKKIEAVKGIADHLTFSYALMALTVVPFAYLVGRLSLVLPAVAVDLRPRVNPSWSLTDRNGWRVTVLVGGIPLLSSTLQVLLGLAVDWLTGISRLSDGNIQWHGTYSIAMSGLQSILHYVLATVEVAILSLTFKELSGWQPSEVQVGKERA